MAPAPISRAGTSSDLKADTVLSQLCTPMQTLILLRLTGFQIEPRYAGIQERWRRKEGISQMTQNNEGFVLSDGSLEQHRWGDTCLLR